MSLRPEMVRLHARRSWPRVDSGSQHFRDTVVALEMVLALFFSLTVVSVGFATLRTLGLAKGAVGLGLAAPAGLAVLALVSSWSMLLGVAPLVAGLLVFGIAAAGVGMALHDRRAILMAAGMLAREHRLAMATLLAAL